MRTFAEARLTKQDEMAAVRRRHAAHFTEIAQDSETGLVGPDADGWIGRLEAAVADLEVALRWAQQHAEIGIGLELSADLWRWWLFSGRLAFGRDWLATFVAGADQWRDERTGRAFCAAAALAAENGDNAEAVRLALRIFEPLGLQERMAFAATMIGSAQLNLGDRAAARRSFQIAMDL